MSFMSHQDTVPGQLVPLGPPALTGRGKDSPWYLFCLPGSFWLGTIGEVRLAGFQGGAAANGERFSPLSYDRPY